MDTSLSGVSAPYLTLSVTRHTVWSTNFSTSSPVESLPVDDGHVPFVVAFAGSRCGVVQPFDLLGTQLEAVGRNVFLDAGDSFGAGNRRDVVALRA